MTTSNNLEMITAIKGRLTSNFDMKNIGDASYVFEVKIHRDQSKMVLGPSQETYLKNFLEQIQDAQLKTHINSNWKEESP